MCVYVEETEEVDGGADNKTKEVKKNEYQTVWNLSFPLDSYPL